MTTPNQPDGREPIISISAAWNSFIRLSGSFDLKPNEEDIVQLLLVSNLEIAKVRLFAWGKVIGLNSGENVGALQNYTTRLNQEPIGERVLRHMLAVEKIFNLFKSTREFHGMTIRVTSSVPTDGGNGSGSAAGTALADMSSALKQCYRALHRCMGNWSSVELNSRIMWSIHDKSEFGLFVSAFGNAIESLLASFPDLKRDVQETVRNAIPYEGDAAGSSVLEQLLQQASSPAEAYQDAVAEVESLHKSIISTSGDYHIPAIAGIKHIFMPLSQDPPMSKAEWSAATAQRQAAIKFSAAVCRVGEKGEGRVVIAMNQNSFPSLHVSAAAYWEEFCQPRESYVRAIKEEKGFMEPTHSSLTLYHRAQYMRRPPFRPFYRNTSEEVVFFDMESEPRYQHVYPGTLTVEGFGLEAWRYAKEHSGPQYSHKTAFLQKMPAVSLTKLLRRFEELQCVDRPFGLNIQEDALDIREIFGDSCLTPFQRVPDAGSEIQQLCSLLDMDNNFRNFTSSSGLATAWVGGSLHPFLRQIILSRELALRLEFHPNAPLPDMSPKIVASLIVQDLYFQNAKISLQDKPIQLKKVDNPDEIRAAEDLKTQGNAAFAKGEHQAAVDFYTQAININPSNAVFHMNRAAAYYHMKKYDQAAEDATSATQLDPQYIKAWVRRADSELKLDKAKKAYDSYRIAIELSGNEATVSMVEGLDNAETKIRADMQRIQAEPVLSRRHALHKAFLDEDWDMSGKLGTFTSSAIERQTQGLLSFASQMKWPYINEVEDYIPKAVENFRKSGSSPLLLFDWFYGCVLPGKWTALTIMSCLIWSSPSVPLAEPAPYYECGLSLPSQTYWRVRTVLGSVLGCLPGVKSLCGWIGPCPPVEFTDPPSHATKDFNKKPHYVHLQADDAAIVKDLSTIPHFDPEAAHQLFLEACLRSGESLESIDFLENIVDPKKWVTPQPLARATAVTCSINAIQLKALPSDTWSEGLNEAQLESQTRYRASIVIEVKNGSRQKTVKYDLNYNSIFVTLPPCHLGKRESHELHKRELLKEKEMDIWALIGGSSRRSLIPGFRTGSSLGDRSNINNDVTIINVGNVGSSGEAEVLARAWCSERGKNAVIRRSGGPCLTCAIRAARPPPVGLGTDVLIWLS
ncbi:tetratricopeptide repeat-containing protein [Blastomyces dermatitidis ER-3]|uniref:Tetratricopeptide repeat-containing protein n=1 Tax=Ajellomyces dermatitidis (strain ER-3 / ATCC MYA-2586) TaxID=559297 RepID=A0ABP2ER42_AJEDR|nr:tetratricopeptide repeat-containing protein [Blastomyces dermatitidis ER-3]EEQ85899.2 tetratricopeptide repeat-containing protein [Blastomyces dermatitidis ER-3]